MKYKLITIFTAFSILQNPTAYAQDSSTTILSEQWLKVRNAQLNLCESIIEFCSVKEIRSTYGPNSNKLVSDAKSFANEIKRVSTLDSTLVVYLEILQDSLFTSTINFARRIQENKILFKKPNIRTAGKKVDYMVEELGRQIHDFNYWVNEKNGWNIRFKDINL